MKKKIFVKMQNSPVIQSMVVMLNTQRLMKIFAFRLMSNMPMHQEVLCYVQV
jgi:hypothetical protein